LVEVIEAKAFKLNYHKREGLRYSYSFA